MVWTGDGFLMGVGTRSRLLADGTLSLVVLDAAGAPQGMPTTLTSRLDRSSPFGGGDPPGMAMGLGEAVVVWPDAAAMAPGLRFVRVAPDGSSLQAATPLPGLGGSPRQTSVAWSGTSYGVVWVEEPASGSEQLVFSRLACP